ncbi:MAG: protein kinase, partial [Armatimonadetes bacterium]|nr:protein kinase [Anaerolineae bacterium]
EIPYLVMRWLTGGTLLNRIQMLPAADEPLPSATEAGLMLGQIASALDYAHQRGVIHRDIKPSNIMYDALGVAYVVDFGIVKVQDSQSITTSSTAMGSPPFMSPEQWSGEPLTPAADQYALAGVLYFMLTGEHPFKGDSPFALMYRHLNDAPPALTAVRPDISPTAAQVISRALAKHPDERYPTTTQFAQAFSAAVGLQDEIPTGVAKHRGRTNPSTTPLATISGDTPTLMAVAPTAVRLTLGLFLVPILAVIVLLGVITLIIVAVVQNDVQPTATPTATTAIVIAPTIDNTPSKSASAYAADGNAALGVGDFQGALPLLDRAIELGVSDPTVYLSRAFANTNLGNVLGAAQDAYAYIGRIEVTSNALTLVPGEGVTVDVAQGQVYRLTFSAQTGQLFTISASTAATGGLPDPLIVLLNPAGNPIIHDDDISLANGVFNLNALIDTYRLPADGAYTVLLTHGSGALGGTGLVDVLLELE